MSGTDIIAAGLGRCAKAALPFVPAHAPGQCWFDILEAAPRNRRGHTMSFAHTIRPLMVRGLVRRIVPPRREDGTRPFDRYHRTPLGNQIAQTMERGVGSAG